ncbi:MAG TPA: uroporphyrinogen decarboxylase family protein [Spirochaetia bacterium]|nr:uroporphyrinogen decarboxylase family protein [Spirochaetia bacterium]
MQGKSLADLTHEAFDHGRRLVAPLAGFPGVEIVGSTIKLAQQNYGEHYRAIRALVDRFQPDVAFPLMDLAVEANALGRYTVFPQEDSATVPKDRFSIDELERLGRINISFDSRVLGYVEMMRMMSVTLPPAILRGGYAVGPFTLAGLMMGADEAAMATVTEPDLLHRLCHFTTERIQEYVQMLISAGAQVICILEPSAVMLSPQQFSEFSAIYIRHITTSFKYSGINFVYHTCGNTTHLVEKMVRSGVNGLSLDSREAGVDLPTLSKQVPEDVVVIGNISPTTTMRFGSPSDVQRDVEELLRQMDRFPNFVLSTGCDLPQETPEENLRVFMEAGRAWHKR